MTRGSTHRKTLAFVSGVLLVAVAAAGCFGQPDPECEILSWDGYPITVTLIDGTKETRQVYPSPQGKDADGDGMDDCVEFIRGTDPNDPDTSANGLLDGENVVLDADHPRALAWIERGIVHFETDDGRLEFQGSRHHRLDPTRQDHAGSGILDGDEVRGFSVWILGQERVVTTDPRAADTSGDGLTDGQKRDMGLDPTTRDTRGDGIQDIHDVNPWIDFRIAFNVSAFMITNDPFSRNQGDLALDLSAPGVFHHGHPEDMVVVGQETDGAEWSAPDLGVLNSVGSLWAGEHNVTFSLQATTQHQDSLHTVDLFSHTAGSDRVRGAIHALSGEASWEDEGGARTSWPAEATFEGEHGWITFRVEPVWPEDWLRCIEDGCPHGAGDFPWR